MQSLKIEKNKIEIENEIKYQQLRNEHESRIGKQGNTVSK